MPFELSPHAYEQLEVERQRIANPGAADEEKLRTADSPLRYRYAAQLASNWLGGVARERLDPKVTRGITVTYSLWANIDQPTPILCCRPRQYKLYKL